MNPESLAHLRQRLLHALEQRRLVEFDREVVETIFDGLPLRGVERLAFGLLKLLAHLFAVLGLIDVRSSDTEDGKFLRQITFFAQIENCRQQLASGEVSGRAEDDEDARISAVRHGRRTAHAARRATFPRTYGRVAIESARTTRSSAHRQALLPRWPHQRSTGLRRNRGPFRQIAQAEDRRRAPAQRDRAARN